MFNRRLKEELQHTKSLNSELNSVLVALTNNFATIEFELDGTVITASSRFLTTVGYQLDEIKGKHHSMFCDPTYTNSSEYKTFWIDLANGKDKQGVFRRLNKSGQSRYLEAHYFPIVNNGKVTKVMKVATDITERYLDSIYQNNVLKALDRSLAVIEFTPEGEIIKANDNFLAAVKYSASELQGKHHRVLCPSEFYTENPNFWEDLQQGRFKAGQFLRIDSHGQNLWLEATYNPIIDESGRVLRVIKFATDVTDEVTRNLAVAKASEVALSTSVETAQIAKRGAELLRDSVAISNQIAENVQTTADKVETLNTKSKSIEDIVSTIRSIAEQTNLLALNAAIEAARAGEQGRGFAVVADEVRSLASRTAASTSEIAAVVAENQQLTDSVTTSMEQVAKTSLEGMNKVSEVSGVMDEIYAGAENVSNTVMTLSETK